MKKLIFFFIIYSILSVSCRKADIAPDTSLTPEMARDSLYYIMKEWYYWYNFIPADLIKENYKDPYDLLESMRYKTLDRWSFVADYNEFEAELQGIFVGHGFRIGVDDSGNARIAMIYLHSPLYANGVRRGWIVKKINGNEVAPVIISGDTAAYNNLIGPSRAGVTNTFIFQKPDGSLDTISSTKSSFTLNTVLLYDTLHLSTGVTGHLVFDSFITPSSQELATAFAFFRANNVNDLILDLRYNSGGLLNIAQLLASYIAGNSYTSTIFAKLQYNSKHPEANGNYFFKSSSYPLNLSRLLVITTRYTASASEAVMNGLSPIVNVVSIGDTTNGKPAGMNGWDIGNKYWMWPVTFKMVNSINQGDYFDGIAPAKVVSDDITHDFDDRAELCLNEAVHYLENGTVTAKSQLQFKRRPQFSEKSGMMNNLFNLDKTYK